MTPLFEELDEPLSDLAAVDLWSPF